MGARTFKSRLQVCGLIAVLPVLPLSGRLVYLGGMRHHTLAGAALQGFKQQISETDLRGSIFDRKGLILARSLPTWSCSMLKTEIVNPSRTITELAKTLGLEADEIRKKWRSASNFLRVKRGFDPETAQRVRDLKLPGVSITQGQTRYYAGKNTAKGLLGAVGVDGIGLSGIEFLYDNVLEAHTRKREVIRDGKGRIIYRPPSKNIREWQSRIRRFIGNGQPFAGALRSRGSRRLHGRDEGAAPGIYLTLDRSIQFFSQQVIRRAVEKNEADLGIIIVEDPKSGELLAVASYPQNNQKTPPFQHVFEPGSTFKLVTFSAALETNAVKIDEEFDCENGSWEFEPRITIRDHEPEGVLTVPKILVRSSNIGSAKIALKTGLENFYSYVRAFGFGTKTGIGFPGESNGILRPAKYWKPVDLAAAGYGYSIGVTGIQIINAYSAIANAGVLMEPRLIRKIVDRNGRTLYSSKRLEMRRVVSKKTALLMRKMLQKAVEEGTGAQARIRSYSVAGKTGTSKKLNADDGKYSTDQYVASFCGFVPASDPQFTILVVIDNPRSKHYGGETAAPAFAEIAKRILALKGVPPDEHPAYAFKRTF